MPLAGGAPFQGTPIKLVRTPVMTVLVMVEPLPQPSRREPSPRLETAGQFTDAEGCHPDSEKTRGRGEAAGPGKWTRSRGGGCGV